MYYPVSLNVDGEPCLVVGGGAVAVRKAKTLYQAGARVTVVSPSFSAGFKRLKVRRIRRRFRAADADGKALAISATDDPAVNRAVSRACRRRRVPVNVVDVPDLCTFIVPSIIRKGPVIVAISTGGTSPGLARALRLHLEKALPASLGPLARRLGVARRRILRALPPSPARTRLLKGLVKNFAGAR